MHVDRIDPSFGHWFAGFVDGEGCFDITAVGLSQSYICRFVIGLRDDDLEILEEIRDATGLGKISFKKPTTVGARRQAWYSIHAKAECAQLAAIFDRFPLRAKKARDFAIWREAVAEWHSCTNRGPLPGRKSRDWTRMGELQANLRAARKYA